MPGQQERVALYDPSDLVGQVVGEAPRSRVRAENLPHGGTGIRIRDSKGRQLLHRRSYTKDLWPGRIDAVCGGVIRAGETPFANACRELAEEVGIVGAQPHEVASLWYRDAQTHYLAFLHDVVWDGPISFPDGEVVHAWWAPPAEVEALLDSEELVPDTRWLWRRLDGVQPDPGPWSRRDPVVVRFGRSGRALAARTARVLIDDENGLVLWVPAGTAAVATVTADGEDLRALPVGERGLVDRGRRSAEWVGPGIYQWFPARYEGWSLWSFFHPNGDFRGWYGNLESAPLRRRTVDGTRYIDVSDRALDVSIPLVAGRPRPAWKDQDEFIAYTGLAGRWGPEHVEQIIAQGRSLWRRAARGQWPFDGHWIVPPLPRDALHEPVALPTDWDLPHVGGP